MGAELSTFSERELSGAYLSLQSGDLEPGLELLAEMLCRPTFPPDRLELERHQIANHIQAMRDDPQVVGSQLLNDWIYRGTPLAKPVLGTPESIDRLTRDQVVDFYRGRFGPGNCVLVAVGDAEFEPLLDIVVAHLGNWENPDFALSTLNGLERQKAPVYEHQPMEKEQVNIYLGHLGITRTNPDFYALQVMDTILGGGPGFTSRIPRKLRDEEGLAYLTYADLTGSSGIYPGAIRRFRWDRTGKRPAGTRRTQAGNRPVSGGRASGRRDRNRPRLSNRQLRVRAPIQRLDRAAAAVDGGLLAGADLSQSLPGSHSCGYP